MSHVVSVIVPIYNVEPYLRSCLDSVVAQSRHCTLDAILVDDGSTDASASIAEEYVERHPYMRLIRKPNGGLGQARNVGAAQARGDSLVFLDSDDILPEGTYAAMTSALAAAPVDFVTGSVVRLKGQATIVSGAHQKSHPADLSATHIREHRGLLWDTTAWNKMFRRGFWEYHNLAFPEGVLYEDMELMTRSHLLATQVAVLKRTCYLWRIRTEWPPSITQCRTDLQNIDDRFTAIFALFDTLQQRGTPELLEAYEHKILSMDMPIYVRHYGKNDTQQYRDRLESYVRRALQQCTTGAIDRTTSVDRLKYWLIAHDRAAEVAGINGCQDTHFDTCPLNVHDGRVLRTYPTVDTNRGALPSSLVDVTSELSPHTTVYDIASDGRDLRMDVHAFVPGLSPETSRAMVRRFSLRNTKSGRRIALNASSWSTRVPTAMLQILHFDGAWSRVTLRLPVDAFVDQAGGEASSTWDVWVECELAGLVWSDRVRRRDGEFMDRERFVETRGGRVRACLSGDDRLQVVLESVAAQTTCTTYEEADAFDIALNSDTFRCGPPEGGPHDNAPALVLRTDHGPVSEWPLGVAGPNGSWTIRGARVVSAMTEAGLTRCRLTVRSGTKEYGVTAFRGFEREWITEDGRVVTASGNADGFLTIVRWPGSRRITDLALDAAGVLRVLFETPPQATAHEDDRLEMVHQEKGCRVTLRPASGHDRARYEVNLAHIDRWSVDTPVPPGEWRFVTRRGRTGQAEYEPAVVGRLRGALPLDCRSNGLRASLRVNDAGSLVLRVMTDWPEEADLLAKRRRLETDLYPVLRRRPVTPSVVFESWAGSAFSDDPRQVYDELARRVPHARMTWIASDPSAMIPKGVTTVLRGTTAYFEALAEARFVVTNSAMHEHFDKREGCTYVRLGRGIPVKRIGADVTGVASLAVATTRRHTADAKRWDMLATGHPEASVIYRRAFNYQGTVFEAGQPRLDALVDANATARRDEVRSRLGIGASERLVLYAPTWRDNLFSRWNQYVMPETLDLGRLLDRLGEGWRLLVKNHPSVANRTGKRLDPRVINGYRYPEMSDLYLAADALVTDYSSSVFDFAVTRKPILIFAPDLEEFSTRTRGVYWDMETDLPGPVLKSTDDVIEHLKTLPEVEAQWRARYDQFHARFCNMEDGRAAQRLVEAVFTDWLD